MPQENKQQFQCSGNCLNCIPQQRAYCASQHSYSNMRVLDKVMEIITDMKEQIRVMQGEVKEMTLKIEAIQNSEADIFDPNSEYIESPDLFPRITEQDAGKAAEKDAEKE